MSKKRHAATQTHTLTHYWLWDIRFSNARRIRNERDGVCHRLWAKKCLGFRLEEIREPQDTHNYTYNHASVKTFLQLVIYPFHLFSLPRAQTHTFSRHTQMYFLSSTQHLLAFENVLSMTCWKGKSVIGTSPGLCHSHRHGPACCPHTA